MYKEKTLQKLNHVCHTNVNNKQCYFSHILLLLLYSLIFLGCQKANKNEKLEPLPLVLKAKQVFSESDSYLEFQEIQRELSDLAEEAKNLPQDIQQEICDQLTSSSDEVLSNFQDFLMKAELTCSSALLDRIDHFWQLQQDLSDQEPSVTKQVPSEPSVSEQSPPKQIPTEQYLQLQNSCVDQNGHFRVRHLSIPTEEYIDGLDLPYGHLALTFDDGPHGYRTLRLLDVLDSRSAKATFFMVGQNVERFPNIALQVASRGHSIGSHSYRHRQLNKIPAEDALESVFRGHEILLDKLSDHVAVKAFFRFPFGALNSNLREAVLGNGLSVFSWSIDTRDWETRNPNRLRQNTWRRIEEADYRGILLFHELEQTILIMPWLLDRLVNAGFCLVLFL